MKKELIHFMKKGRLIHSDRALTQQGPIDLDVVSIYW